MATLTAAQRRRLPRSAFAEPGQRKYPLTDKQGRPSRTHAGNAKARAAQQVKEGKMSRAEQKKINARADLMLYGGTHGQGPDHVFLVDGTGRGTQRGRVRPDTQPRYKIKPNTGRKERDAIKARTRRRR